VKVVGFAGGHIMSDMWLVECLKVILQFFPLIKQDKS